MVKPKLLLLPLFVTLPLGLFPIKEKVLNSDAHRSLVAAKIAYLNPQKVSHLELLDSVIEAETYYGISADVLLAVGLVESNFNPNAISPRDAHGLMQVKPETALWHWNDFIATLPEGHGLKNADPVNHLHSVSTSVLFGAYYLNLLKASVGNDLEKALASYNVGPNRFRRTLANNGRLLGSKYVKKVLTAMDTIKGYRPNL